MQPTPAGFTGIPTFIPTFTVSGQVTEMTDDGPVPVEGVIVDELAIISPPQPTRAATTR